MNTPPRGRKPNRLNARVRRGDTPEELSRDLDDLTRRVTQNEAGIKALQERVEELTSNEKSEEP